MRLLATALYVALLGLAGQPVAAAERSDGFAALLAHVPAAMLTADPGLSISFHDFAASRRAVNRSGSVRFDPGSPRPFDRLVGLPSGLVNTMTAGLRGGWRENAGFGPADIVALVSVDRPPSHLMLLDLIDTADLGAVGPALLAGGYQARALGDWSAWWRGEKDNGIDMAMLDHGHPFGGDLGRASRVATDGDIIAYATTWPAIEAVAASPAAPLAAAPDMAALLAALDDPRFADASLVQAMLLPAPWPADGAVGLPPWRLGLLADLSTGAVDFGIAAVVYDDRQVAVSAAELLLENWRVGRPPSRPESSFAELTGGVAQSFVVGDRPAALVLAIERPTADDPDNPRNIPFYTLLSAYYYRDLILLGVR